MAGTGKFEAGGDEGDVEVLDVTKLYFEAELDGGGGDSFAFEDPSSAVCEGCGETGKDAGAVFVTKTL